MPAEKSRDLLLNLDRQRGLNSQEPHGHRRFLFHLGGQCFQAAASNCAGRAGGPAPATSHSLPTTIACITPPSARAFSFSVVCKSGLIATTFARFVSVVASVVMHALCLQVRA